MYKEDEILQVSVDALMSIINVCVAHSNDECHKCIFNNDNECIFLNTEKFQKAPCDWDIEIKKTISV